MATWLASTLLLGTCANRLTLLPFRVNRLRGKSFADEADLHHAVRDFFASKTPGFLTPGHIAAGGTFAKGSGCRW